MFLLLMSLLLMSSVVLHFIVCHVFYCDVRLKWPFGPFAFNKLTDRLNIKYEQ